MGIRITLSRRPIRYGSRVIAQKPFPSISASRTRRRNERIQDFANFLYRGRNISFYCIWGLLKENSTAGSSRSLVSNRNNVLSDVGNITRNLCSITKCGDAKCHEEMDCRWNCTASLCAAILISLPVFAQSLHVPASNGTEQETSRRL